MIDKMPIACYHHPTHLRSGKCPRRLAETPGTYMKISLALLCISFLSAAATAQERPSLGIEIAPTFSTELLNGTAEIHISFSDGTPPVTDYASVFDLGLVPGLSVGLTRGATRCRLYQGYFPGDVAKVETEHLRTMFTCGHRVGGVWLGGGPIANMFVLRQQEGITDQFGNLPKPELIRPGFGGRAEASFPWAVWRIPLELTVAANLFTAAIGAEPRSAPGFTAPHVGTVGSFSLGVSMPLRITLR
jgi:hypothetical protein